MQEELRLFIVKSWAINIVWKNVPKESWRVP